MYRKRSHVWFWAHYLDLTSRFTIWMNQRDSCQPFLFVYTYTPAASFCFQKTSSDKYTVRCSHRNKCLGDRVSRRSTKQGNSTRHNSSDVRRNERHIGNGSALVDISGKCQHCDAIKSVIYVWSQSVKESFWIIPVRLLNKSLVYSSNLRSEKPHHGQVICQCEREIGEGCVIIRGEADGVPYWSWWEMEEDESSNCIELMNILCVIRRWSAVLLCLHYTCVCLSGIPQRGVWVGGGGWKKKLAGSRWGHSVAACF